MADDICTADRRPPMASVTTRAQKICDDVARSARADKCPPRREQLEAAAQGGPTPVADSATGKWGACGGALSAQPLPSHIKKKSAARGGSLFYP